MPTKYHRAAALTSLYTLGVKSGQLCLALRPTLDLAPYTLPYTIPLSRTKRGNLHLLTNRPGS